MSAKTSAKRVVFSIDAGVLAKFNKRYGVKARSRIVEQFMLDAINRDESEVGAAARLLATDPAFAEYDAVAEWADGQATDTLSYF